MSKSPITARIDLALKDKGISKSKFYKDCEITSAAYSLWNQGKTVPSMKNVTKIAEYLELPISYLLDGDKKEKPTPEGEQLPEITLKLIERIKRMDIDQQTATLLLLNSLGKQEG